MATPTPFEVEHRHHSRLVWISLAIALVVLGIVFISAYVQQRHRKKTVVAAPIIVSSPLSYYDFLGTVEKTADKNLTVVATITDQKGKQVRLTYQVLQSDATMVKEVSDTTSSDIALTDIQAGDQVQVAANQNLANLDHFTATKILKISAH